MYVVGKFPASSFLANSYLVMHNVQALLSRDGEGIDKAIIFSDSRGSEAG